MAIPWTPHLADLQPADDSTPFEYSELDLTLVFKTDSTRISMPAVYLYGSKEAANTIVELAPGARVRIRSSARLRADEAVSKRAQQEPQAAWEANATFGYRHDSFHPHPGGYGINISNDYPRSMTGDPLVVHIYPAADGGSPTANGKL